MKKLLNVMYVSACLLLLGSCAKRNHQVVEASGEANASEVTTESVGAAGISGLNWADGRDNFVDGWVIPSG